MHTSDLRKEGQPTIHSWNQQSAKTSQTPQLALLHLPFERESMFYFLWDIHNPQCSLLPNALSFLACIVINCCREGYQEVTLPGICSLSLNFNTGWKALSSAKGMSSIRDQPRASYCSCGQPMRPLGISSPPRKYSGVSQRPLTPRKCISIAGIFSWVKILLKACLPSSTSPC